MKIKGLVLRLGKDGCVAKTTPTLLCRVAQMQKLQTRQVTCAKTCSMAILAMISHGQVARATPTRSWLSLLCIAVRIFGSSLSSQGCKPG